MPPTRSSTAASLTQYLQSINGDLHLASVLAFRASSPPTPSLSQSHVIELVLWVEEDQEDVRSRFSVASVELERLDVVAQSMGGKAGDVEGFRRMLLAKGEEKAAQQGEKSEEGTKTYSVVVFAIYRRPPAPGAALAQSQEPFSLIRVLNYTLPTPYSSPPELQNASAQLEDWRHILARGVLEPWKGDTKFEVVAQMAVLRAMERQQLTPAEREKRDQVEFGHLTRRLLHAAAPLAS